ncbi:MAG TPA: methanogenesis marker 3 protein [Methanoregulaceae archaeon]|nr:methanogenesis marker 3 protein [Methanoregulaceae archaeon]
MITIHLDGERLEIDEGCRLKDVFPARDPDCCIAIIRPGARESAETKSFQLVTSTGEIGIEAVESGLKLFDSPDIAGGLKLHWTDRYAAAFGPFSSDISPDRTPHLYERGDVILGCGGYDPKRSYLIFCKMRHYADFGASSDGGVIARVVSGRGVLDRWSTGDEITAIQPVISWADTSRSFTTVDDDLLLEDGMEVVTFAKICAYGYSGKTIRTEAAGSVEHLLLAMLDGHFVIGRNSSTHIRDNRRSFSDVPEEVLSPRRDGTVTIRTRGNSRGSVYIYTADVPSIPSHTTVGQITHGIALARLAQEGEIFCVQVEPERFDLVGKSFKSALETAENRGIKVEGDLFEGEGIVVSQFPSTTMECLSRGSVTLVTVPLENVIDIRLGDNGAPVSCDIFRRMTGLHLHDVGSMPFYFNFEDVYLFKPEIKKGVIIIPENIPVEVVPSGSLAITNDSRKGAGMVGTRLSENREFGPTSEPFEGTNIIGSILDTEKIRLLKEKETVYIREVKS